MRQLRAIILVSVALGLISLSIPIRFYGTMSGIFGSLSPAPFDFSVVRTFTFIFALPAITLLLLGIAVYYITLKLERVAELEVLRETGEARGTLKKIRVVDEEIESIETEKDRSIKKGEILAIDDTIIVKEPKDEFEGKEVYSEVGDFLGYVRDVKTDDSGEVFSIGVEKRDIQREIAVEDVLSVENVIIIKA